MSEQTEKALLRWEEGDSLIDHDLHVHFTEFGRWYWPEVSDEAVRVENLMFGSDIHEESPRADVYHAACAQASNGAMSAMAAALGLELEVVGLALAPWFENQDNPPPAVSAARFMELCAESKEWLANYGKGESEIA